MFVANGRGEGRGREGRGGKETEGEETGHLAENCTFSVHKAYPNAKQLCTYIHVHVDLVGYETRPSHYPRSCRAFLTTTYMCVHSVHVLTLSAISLSWCSRSVSSEDSLQVCVCESV